MKFYVENFSCNDLIIQSLRNDLDCFLKINLCFNSSGGRDGVVNPMVHNMVPAYEAAKYNLVWVSTSRVKGRFAVCSV